MSDPEGRYVHSDNPRQAFQEVADRLGIGFRVGEPEWVTAWDVRNNIADRYRNGRLLICGDASHVHSPSGGQGMNGCMQDAFNLGWKLAAVYDGVAKDSILDTYERERKPVGKQITEGAMATHEIVMGFGIEPADRYYLTQEPGWEQRTINLVSGLSHNYRDSVVLPAGFAPRPGPQPGERAPDAVLTHEPKKRVYDILRHPCFSLVIVPGRNRRADIGQARDLRSELERLYPGQVSCILVQSEEEFRETHPDPGRATLALKLSESETESEFDYDHAVVDSTGEIRSRYRVGDEGLLILVRPDLYLGLTCLPHDGGSIVAYLKQWFC